MSRMNDTDRDNVATLIEKGVSDETISQVLGWGVSMVRKLRCVIDLCKNGKMEEGLGYIDHNEGLHNWIKKRFGQIEEPEPESPNTDLNEIKQELVAIRLLLEKLL